MTAKRAESFGTPSLLLMAIIMAFGVWGSAGLYAQSSAAPLEAATPQGLIDTVVVPQDTLAVIESAELDSAWIQRADSAWWAWCEAGYCLSIDGAIWYAGTASRTWPHNWIPLALSATWRTSTGGPHLTWRHTAPF